MDYGDSRDLHEYVDFGARCHTSEGHKSLDEFVQTTGDAPDVRVPGTYQIQYHCEDEKGVSVSAARTVVVTGEIVVKCPYVVVNGVSSGQSQYSRMGLYKFQRYFKGSPIYKQILLPPPLAKKPDVANFMYPVRAPSGSGQASYWLIDKTHLVEPEHKGLQAQSAAPTPDQISKDKKGGGTGFKMVIPGMGLWRGWDTASSEWRSMPKVGVMCAPKILQSMGEASQHTNTHLRITKHHHSQV